MAGLPRSLRGNLKRLLNRLGEKGRVELGWCATIADADAVLDWLFANKRKWSRERGYNTRFLQDDRVRDFFRALARRTDLPTTPLIAFVKVDGVPVAASVNLVGDSCVEYLITTYDEAFQSYSVGNLLLNLLVKWSFDNDRDFDMRYLYSDYKARWSNRQVSYTRRYVFLSARGRLAEIASLAEYSVRVARKIGKVIVSSLTKRREAA